MKLTKSEKWINQDNSNNHLAMRKQKLLMNDSQISLNWPHTANLNQVPELDTLGLWVGHHVKKAVDGPSPWLWEQPVSTFRSNLEEATMLLAQMTSSLTEHLKWIFHGLPPSQLCLVRLLGLSLERLNNRHCRGPTFTNITSHCQVSHSFPPHPSVLGTAALGPPKLLSHSFHNIYWGPTRR